MGYYNSFIIRIWSDEQGRLRGRIEHVASQDYLIFSDLRKVVKFIRSHLGVPSYYLPDTPEEAPDELGGVGP
ncbi:MAG: hypothetical protein C4309_11780 [Chloroflexota bacterium]